MIIDIDMNRIEYIVSRDWSVQYALLCIYVDI